MTTLFVQSLAGHFTGAILWRGILTGGAFFEQMTDRGHDGAAAEGALQRARATGGRGRL